MNKASFALVNYKFNEVSLNLDNKISDDLKIDFEPSGFLNIKDGNYVLNFKTNVLTEKEIDGKLNEKEFISINCSALFKFKELTSEDDVPEFFYRNAVAILFPYVRAYISLLTTQANIKGVILPTLNLTRLEPILKGNTVIN